MTSVPPSQHPSVDMGQAGGTPFKGAPSSGHKLNVGCAQHQVPPALALTRPWALDYRVSAVNPPLANDAQASVCPCPELQMASTFPLAVLSSRRLRANMSQNELLIAVSPE